MMVGDEIQRVASVLERPHAGFVKQLEQAQRAAMARSGEAARQLGVFADRVSELTLEELRELHDETFRADQAMFAPLIRRLVRAPASRLQAARAIRLLAPLLDRLERERNPHAYVVKSLCCVLLLRVDQSGPQEGRHRGR